MSALQITAAAAERAGELNALNDRIKHDKYVVVRSESNPRGTFAWFA